MKRIIGKKIYDTEKSQLIFSYESGHNYADYSYYEESLYLTKSGAFFLYGKGQAASRYAKHVGNMSYGGEEVSLLTPAQAYEFLERHNAVEAILKYFPGEILEG